MKSEGISEYMGFIGLLVKMVKRCSMVLFLLKKCL